MCNESISTRFLPLWDCLLCPRAPFLWEDVKQEVELARIPCGAQAAISCANPCHAVPANGSAQTTVRKTVYSILWETRTRPSPSSAVVPETLTCTYGEWMRPINQIKHWYAEMPATFRGQKVQMLEEVLNRKSRFMTSDHSLLKDKSENVWEEWVQEIWPAAQAKNW